MTTALIRTISLAGASTLATAPCAYAQADPEIAPGDELFIEETPLSADALSEARGGFKVGGLEFDITVDLGPITGSPIPEGGLFGDDGVFDGEGPIPDDGVFGKGGVFGDGGSPGDNAAPQSQNAPGVNQSAGSEAQPAGPPSGSMTAQSAVSSPAAAAGNNNAASSSSPSGGETAEAPANNNAPAAAPLANNDASASSSSGGGSSPSNTAAAGTETGASANNSGGSVKTASADTASKDTAGSTSAGNISGGNAQVAGGKSDGGSTNSGAGGSSNNEGSMQAQAQHKQDSSPDPDLANTTANADGTPADKAEASMSFSLKQLEGADSAKAANTIMRLVLNNTKDRMRFEQETNINVAVPNFDVHMGLVRVSNISTQFKLNHTFLGALN